MDKKKIILIVVIIAVVAVGAYFLLNSEGESVIKSSNNTTMFLSKSAVIVIPESSNKTDKVNKKGTHFYKDSEYDINITSCSNLSTSAGLKEIKKLKNSFISGSEKSRESVKGNDVIVFEKGGVYSIFVKNTEYNNTLVLQSSNKDLLLQCWETVLFHDPTEKVKIEDTSSSGSGSVIDVYKKTEKAVESSSSSSSSESDSSSNWGYQWKSGSSDTVSYSSSRVGGSASSSDLFDYT